MLVQQPKRLERASLCRVEAGRADAPMILAVQKALTAAALCFATFLFDAKAATSPSIDFFMAFVSSRNAASSAPRLPAHAPEEFLVWGGGLPAHGPPWRPRA